MTPDLPIPVEDPDQTDFICRWQGCDLGFDTLPDLVNHLTASHVTIQTGNFFCMWQGCQREKGFNARYKMLIHIRTHTNERPFECTECGKRFSRQENLRIHARTHTGEKPYVCSVPGCNKAYSNSSDRFKHTRTHQVDKPYECRQPGCGKRYTDPSSLRKHVKIYGHLKKNEEQQQVTLIPSPSPPSGSSSLGASPVPLAPTPPSLLPAAHFIQQTAGQNNLFQQTAGQNNIFQQGQNNIFQQTAGQNNFIQQGQNFGGMNFPSLAAFTMALQQRVPENLKQFYADNYSFLTKGRPVTHDSSFGSSQENLHSYVSSYSPPKSSYSPPKSELFDESSNMSLDIRSSPGALDLSVCSLPLDLSKKRANRDQY